MKATQVQGVRGRGHTVSDGYLAQEKGSCGKGKRKSSPAAAAEAEEAPELQEVLDLSAPEDATAGASAEAPATPAGDAGAAAVSALHAACAPCLLRSRRGQRHDTPSAHAPGAAAAARQDRERQRIHADVQAAQLARPRGGAAAGAAARVRGLVLHVQAAACRPVLKSVPGLVGTVDCNLEHALSENMLSPMPIVLSITEAGASSVGVRPGVYVPCWDAPCMGGRPGLRSIRAHPDPALLACHCARLAELMAQERRAYEARCAEYDAKRSAEVGRVLERQRLVRRVLEAAPVREAGQEGRCVAALKLAAVHPPLPCRLSSKPRDASEVVRLSAMEKPMHSVGQVGVGTLAEGVGGHGCSRAGRQRGHPLPAWQAGPRQDGRSGMPLCLHDTWT